MFRSLRALQATGGGSDAPVDGSADSDDSDDSDDSSSTHCL
jgi:hypothetical protein